MGESRENSEHSRRLSFEKRKYHKNKLEKAQQKRKGNYFTWLKQCKTVRKMWIFLLSRVFKEHKAY